VKVAGVAVPSTEVKFAVKSGAGSLSERSARTNSSGVASTTLTSIIDGDVVVVMATAGGISSDSDSVNFFNPNKPLSVALVASPASGTTQANGGVTLTATVTPVSATGTIANGTVVTFTITSGSGTLSAVSTTTGGVATATLNATTANTVAVTAKADTAISAPLSVTFIDQPTKAIIKLSTTGVPAGTLIGGLDLTVTLPAGVTLQKNADNTAITGAVTGSGAATGVGATSNVLTPNTVRFAMATTAGFAGGEFATIVADVAVGTFSGTVTAAFNGNVIDTSVLTIAGVGLSVGTVYQ
jgi:adhesin/invasin